MNKKEYLAELRNGLSGLPQEEIEERVTFYILPLILPTATRNPIR